MQPPGGQPPQIQLPNIKHIVAVASGKGGVGKSTVATNLALALQAQGRRVGLMDADIYGPSIPIMLGLNVSGASADPVEKYGLKVMSMGFVLAANQAAVLRGPMIHKYLSAFLTQVNWGDLDYLLIDLPPGTGDAQLSLSQTAPLSGALTVVTPQDVSLTVARRGMEMFRQVRVPLLGIVENMSYFIGEDGKRYDIFGKGGGRKLAEAAGVPFLGEIPIDPRVTACGDAGEPIVHKFPDSPVAKAYLALATTVSQELAKAPMQQELPGLNLQTRAGPPMPDFDRGFKIAAHHSGREMCRLAHVECDAWEPIGDTVQTTERLADRAFRARAGGEDFVVYFEAFLEWRDTVLWNILAKSALLSERERLPVRTFVFVLTPDGYRVQGGTFRQEVAGRPTQQIWFTEICLWRQKPESWWDQVPGLMALLPLCDHGLDPDDAVLHAARNIKVQVTDTVARADLLVALAVYGKMTRPLAEMVALIGRQDMRESAFFDEVMALGRLETRRADILEVLEARFGSDAAEEVADGINAVKDTAKLSALLRLAAKSRGLGKVRKALLADQE